jgi:hypothetical protein
MMYGSERNDSTELQNLDSHGCKAKVSSPNYSKAKLNSSKTKASWSKHKHKNHSEKHKADKK